MTDYTKLVEALRCTMKHEKVICAIKECSYNKGKRCKALPYNKLFHDASDAIEALQARVSKLEERTKAQQERLEDYMERQTYIDHYGDKWMTSAKDVPTAAYEHGYADGRDEAEAQLPKRGEWITIRMNNGRSYTGCSCCEAPIPTDTMLDYIPESESKYCYSCGAKMEAPE